MIVHDKEVVGPITASNLSLSKGLAAERARNLLGDPDFEMNLTRLCDCGKVLPKVPVNPQGTIEPVIDAFVHPRPTDETEEGFASLAKQKLEEDYVLVEGMEHPEDAEDSEHDEDAMEVQEHHST